MKFSSFSAAILGALLVTISSAPPRVSASPAAAPTPVPMGHPDFSSMQFLLGTWTCHGVVRGKDRPDTSTTTMALDGQYMLTHDTAPSFDKYRTRAIKSETYTTYNSRTHEWVNIGVDSFGGYFVSATPGWEGDTMTTHIVMAQDGTTGSDVLTKTSDSQTIDKAVSKSPNGTITKSTAVCTKGT